MPELSALELYRTLHLPAVPKQFQNLQTSPSNHQRVTKSLVSGVRQRQCYDLRNWSAIPRSPLPSKLSLKNDQNLVLVENRHSLHGLSGAFEDSKEIIEVPLSNCPITWGIVIGGATPAPGINNIVVALAHLLEKQSKQNSSLYGFHQGPLGLLSLSATLLWNGSGQGSLHPALNLSGTGVLGCGSFRSLQAAGLLRKAARKVKRSTLNGLIVAAPPGEFALIKEFADAASPVPVIVVPCSVEGTPTMLTVGLDTCRQATAEFAGNIGIDSVSSRKYYHFTRTGRQLLSLETALAIAPTMAILGEDKSCSLERLVNRAVDVILHRAGTYNKRSGTILLASDLLTSNSEIQLLCGALRQKPLTSSSVKSGRPMNDVLDEPQERMLRSLPDAVQSLLVQSGDPSVLTDVEEIFATMVDKEIRRRGAFGSDRDLGLLYRWHNVVDAGICATPTDLDCCLAYASGLAAGLFVHSGVSSRVVTFKNTQRPLAEWTAVAFPLDSPSIGVEGMVKQDSVAYRVYTQMADSWAVHDSYRSPGPMQFHSGSINVGANCLPYVLSEESPSDLQLRLGLEANAAAQMCPQQKARLNYSPRYPSFLNSPFEIREASVTARLSSRPAFVELLFPHTHLIRSFTFQECNQRPLSTEEEAVGALQPPFSPTASEHSTTVGLCGFVGGRSIVKLPVIPAAPVIRCFSADFQSRMTSHRGLERSQKNRLQNQVRLLDEQESTQIVDLFQDVEVFQPPSRLKGEDVETESKDNSQSRLLDNALPGSQSVELGTEPEAQELPVDLPENQPAIAIHAPIQTSASQLSEAVKLTDEIAVPLHRQWSWCDAVNAPNFRCGEITTPPAVQGCPPWIPGRPWSGALTQSQNGHDTVTFSDDPDDLEGGKALPPGEWGEALSHIIPQRRPVKKNGPLKVAICFLGRPAPGALNVIWGALEYLTRRGGILLGCDGGLDGLLRGFLVPLKLPNLRKQWANQGGLGSLCRTGDQCESPADLLGVWRTCERYRLDSLLLCGGASAVITTALLTEVCVSRGCQTSVNTIPMSIENGVPLVDMTLGHATTLAVFEGLVGNFMSSSRCGRIWSFLRISGRSQSSQLCAECALATHPSLVLISEEIAQEKMSLIHLTSLVADAVEARHRQGLDYGVVLLSDSLLEFVPEIGVLLTEINALTQREEDFARSCNLPSAETEPGRITFSPHITRAQGTARRRSSGEAEVQSSLERLQSRLTPWSAALYASLPPRIQCQLAFHKDRQLQVDLANVETEMLLAELVQSELSTRKAAGGFRDGVFRVQAHSLTYQARAALPLNVDCDLGFTLGYSGAALAETGKTGYLLAAQGPPTALEPETWSLEAVPAVSLIEVEHPPPRASEAARNESSGRNCSSPWIRLCLQIPRKMLAPAQRELMRHRSAWLLHDAFRNPGPVQFHNRKWRVPIEEQSPLVLLHEVCDLSRKIQHLCERHALTTVPQVARTVMESGLQVLHKIIAVEQQDILNNANSNASSSDAAPPAVIPGLPFLRGWLRIT